MPTVTLLAISDIHVQFDRFPPKTLPDADLVLIAGDLTNDGLHDSPTLSPIFLAWILRQGRKPEEFLSSEREIDQARTWMTQMTERYPVLWIPGNHDIGLDNMTFADIPNCTGILDKTVEYGGLSIHGVSQSPGDDYLVRRWAYMTNDLEVERVAYQFDPVDIVLSHCPPYGGLTDQSADALGDGWQHFGSRALSEYIERHAPRLVFCGHVHEAERYEKIGRTEVHNCAERWMLLTVTTE